jgi:transcription-repair coupling factor (superfamily II helicase)
MDFPPLKKIWSPQSLSAVTRWLESEPDCAVVEGLVGSSDALFIAGLWQSRHRPVCVLTPNAKRAESLLEECASLIGAEQVSLLPSRDAIPYNMKSPFGPTVESRFETLQQLMAGNKKVYVAPAATLLQKLPSPRDLFNRTIHIQPGDEISPDTLAGWLQDNGFRRETAVEDLGTFAIRGGIFDIYPFLAEYPLRLEFWGDTIESVRYFDIFSQKSRGAASAASIFPMSEFNIGAEQIDRALAAMKAYCDQAHIPLQGVHRLEHAWKTLLDFEGIEWYLHWFDLPHTSLFDFLPPESILVWDDLYDIERRLDEARQNYMRHIERAPELFLPLVSPPDKLLFAAQDIIEQLSACQRVAINTLPHPPEAQAIRVTLQEQPSFGQAIEPLIDDFRSRRAEGYEIYLVSPNIGHAERLSDLIGEQCPEATIALGYLERGFVDPAGTIAWYTENQLFTRTHYRPVRTRKVKSAAPISGFDQLTPGDFVVHVDHGIARFTGVERIRTGDMRRDCMVLLYRDSAKLYVPVDDFHKVQKYLARDAAQPALSKLGTAAWERLKERTRNSLKEMAQELVDLYAKRQYLEGIHFPGDTTWQKEFEDEFIYEETPDQLTAIQDVKENMESNKPMDRLVCGDVGFGKTEVAMRAAFKAVMSGFQAAILAPTTVLAAQHFATFTERMANFPVKLGQLSRFLSAREQRETVERAKAGKIDILIGTHRLLSQDVGFKNLGLLVIDEEQRFGVRHKEKLKQYRYKVDVLSMTATPIPRTLHMSLIGARDLSIINTPPRNRLPVQTHVLEYHDEVLKSAIEFELERGGQAYVVHNRIKNLYILRDRIEHLVPRARVIIAHGQMDEKELQNIMQAFIAGRFDVLLSTVIIENGLDIPNVNTIIINRADAMGLSQLYQLRGRVGRSSEQAFAYLLTPSFRQVSEISLRRLRALEQYTDLGSGFQIAMRDLEIRGAGNVLGTRQHGFIAAVGFELYCKLLKEAVDEIQGVEQQPAKPETKVDLPLEAFIPAEYVSDSAARVSIYQELSAAESLDAVAQVEESLIDRFGPLPRPVLSLTLIMRVKALAKALGISRLSLNAAGELVLAFEGDEKTAGDHIKHILAHSPYAFEVIYDTPVLLRAPLHGAAAAQRSDEILVTLRAIAEKSAPVSAQQ